LFKKEFYIFKYCHYINLIRKIIFVNRLIFDIKSDIMFLWVKEQN